MAGASFYSRNRVNLRTAFDEPLPEQTDTYIPVPNERLFRDLTSATRRAFGQEPRDVQVGLSRKNQQMFGVRMFDVGHEERGLALGFRNSYDKSLPVCIGIGTNVFVCDNLMFSSDFVNVMRKHTKNVWGDLDRLLRDSVESAERKFWSLEGCIKALEATPVNVDEGFEHLGRAIGHEVIQPQQLSLAVNEWRQGYWSGHRNAWGLYNAFTEGLKRGAAGTLLGAHTKVHDFMLESFQV